MTHGHFALARNLLRTTAIQLKASELDQNNGPEMSLWSILKVGWMELMMINVLLLFNQSESRYSLLNCPEGYVHESKHTVSKLNIKRDRDGLAEKVHIVKPGRDDCYWRPGTPIS